MSTAQYTFLPWARQGISKDINQQDTLGPAAGQTGRATVDVSLRMEGLPVGGNAYQLVDTVTEDPAHPGKPVYKKVQIIGPGDITGIKTEAVVRTEPRPDVGNFEPNYFPYIEFYEEDFPWRYTPASEQNGKLRPWLTLVVLEEAEFERRFLPGSPLPVITNGRLPIAFPPASETWAWAHVQANKPLLAGSEATELQNLVHENPNLASARLICPRRLKANTRYTAFLLPAFEQGRLAGLGASAERILGEDIQLPSWGAHQNDEYQQLWPVYFEWDFQTSDLADFEYLVRRIEARVMEDPVGRRPMDMQQAGYELSYSEQSGVLRVEGALQIIDADDSRTDFIGQVEAQDFITGLQQLLNLNAPSESGGDSAPTPDQLLFTDGEEDDPIVTPPLYGQWHAGKNQVGDGSDKPWFRQLNLDPRNRVAAGFGTLVVRKNQDAYMDRAWEQAADILEAQRRIRMARFSAETARRLQKSYFEGMDETTYSAFSSSMHSRSLFPDSNADMEAVGKTIRSRVLQTSTLSETLGDRRGERSQKLEEKSTAEGERADLLQQIQDKEVEIVDKGNQINQLITEIDQLVGEISDLEGDIASKNTSIEEKNTAIAALDTAIADLDTEIASLNTAISALELTLAGATLQSEINSLNAQISTKKGERTTLVNERDEKIGERNTLTGQRDQLVTERDLLITEKGEKETLRDTKTSDRNTAQNELAVLNNQLAGLRIAEEAKRNEIQDIEEEIATLEQEILRLSRLQLPTSTLRQDYRKVARVNGPLLRRADIGQVGLDPVIEIALEVEDEVTGSSSERITTDWKDIEWGADTFKKVVSGPIEITEFLTTTPALVRSQIRHFMEAYRGLNGRLRQLMDVKTQAANIPDVDTRTRPLLAYPEFREATYEALAKVSSELMLPNVQRIPMDTFSLLEVNQRFIEAYLVGLNHEMARELMWREFPTDQRGSFFRSFWDDTDNLATTFPPPDIELLTKMDGALGQNLPSGGPTPDDPNLVFVIRSELLKKFPNALVYMQKAKDIKAPRGLTTETDVNHRLMPIFQAKIDPEIAFFGFPIDAETAMGSETDPGWFFVVQERPGEPRFGLDITAEEAGSTFNDIGEWNDLAWPHMGTLPHEFLSIQGKDSRELRPEEAAQFYTWGHNAAHMAGILLQLPFRAAVHATDMLKLPNTNG